MLNSSQRTSLSGIEISCKRVMGYFIENRKLETDYESNVGFWGGEQPDAPSPQHWVRCAPLGSHNPLGPVITLFTLSCNSLLPWSSPLQADFLAGRVYIWFMCISLVHSKGFNPWPALRKCFLMGWVGTGRYVMGYKVRYLEEPSGREARGEEISLERRCPRTDMRKYGPDPKQ